MNSAVAAMQASTPQSIACAPLGGTAFSSASTAMCTLARYTAAPPTKENITIMMTEAGSGQASGLFMT